MLKNIDNLFRSAVTKRDLIELKALVNNRNYSFDIDQTVVNGTTALHIAVANRNMFMTRLLLANGANIERKTKYGDSCLHLAARVNNVEFVNLYAKRMDVDETNSAGNTALHIALLCNNYGVIETLLKGGAKVDEQNCRGQTPLHIAVNKKFVRPIKLLLKYRADPNVLDREGYTPFHVCFYRFEDEELLECMLKHGADPDVKTHLGENALHLAVKHEYVECVRDAEEEVRVQKSGKIVDPTVEAMLSTMRLLMRRGVDVNAEDKFGNTPLYVVFCSRKLKVFEYLLTEGADVNCTPRCRPIFAAVENGDAKMVKYLADREVDASLKNDKGENALKVAMRCVKSEKRCLAILKTLLDNGADFEEDEGELTILETAMTTRNDLDVLRLLLKRGAPVNRRNGSHESPLYFAVKRDLYEAAKILTGKGADVTDHDAENVSILSLAIAEDNERMVKLIFDNIEVMDSRVFWYIEDIKSTDMLKLLENRLRLYGRPYLNGPDGVPILVHAINLCQPSMVRYILNKGVNVNVEYKNHVPLVHARSAYLESAAGNKASKEIVFLMIRQLALLSAQNLHVHKANVELIECNGWMFDYYVDCHQELELMRDTKICRGSSLSYYDILTRRCNGLIRCLRQDAIVEKLDSGGYRHLFEIYADKLEFNYTCGLQWVQEMDQFRDVLMDSLGDVLLYDVICEVNQYYNDKDYAKCLRK